MHAVLAGISKCKQVPGSGVWRLTMTSLSAASRRQGGNAGRPQYQQYRQYEQQHSISIIKTYRIS